MAREIRVRYRDLLLAAVVALLADVVGVALVYAIDLSPFGPLRRFYGPWGLPCLSSARCPRPCAASEGDARRPTEASFLGEPHRPRVVTATPRQRPECADVAPGGRPE